MQMGCTRRCPRSNRLALPIPGSTTWRPTSPEHRPARESSLNSPSASARRIPRLRRATTRRRGEQGHQPAKEWRWLPPNTIVIGGRPRAGSVVCPGGKGRQWITTMCGPSPGPTGGGQGQALSPPSQFSHWPGRVGRSRFARRPAGSSRNSPPRVNSGPPLGPRAAIRSASTTQARGSM